MNNFKLFSTLIRVSQLKWQHTLESVQALQGQFIKLSLLCYPCLTKELCIASYHISRQIVRIGRKSGWLFAALYLKNAQAALQMAYGGDQVPILDFPISLTRAGYPTIIPTYHRKIIRQGDSRADNLVKWYLSLLSVCKLIELMPKVSRQTLNTITDILTPAQEMSLSYIVDHLFERNLSGLLLRYLPRVSESPLFLGMTWVPTWKTMPSYASVKYLGHLPGCFGKPADIGRPIPKSPYFYWTLELKTFSFLNQFIAMKREQVVSFALWPELTVFAFDPRNEDLCKAQVNKFVKGVLPYIPVSDPAHRKYCPAGLLSSAPAGRGKRRVFAIGNFINQRLLKPVHNWLMALLRKLPTDGTFHQERPFCRLIGRDIFYSFDLSAATDRMPLRLLFHVMNSMFGKLFASSIVNSALATQTFDVQFVGRPHERHPVSFIVGQPLGMYSSWPLFALTHHVLVWTAADLVYPGRLFQDYALLGDDIVISDEGVAKTYKELVGGLGVKISDLKSLVSHKGAAEFAKKFRVKQLRVDLSPVSIKSVTGSHHPAGITALIVTNPNLSFRKILRLNGAGYKVRSRLRSRLPRQYARVDALFSRYHLPMPFWFGRGRPLNPYLAAELARYAISRLSPKDLEYPDVSAIPMKEGDWNSSAFLEYSLFRGQMGLWLKYLLWYIKLVRDYDLGVDPMELLSRLMDCPVVITDCLVKRVEPELIRFGIIKQCFDKVQSLGLDWTPPLLGELSDRGEAILENDLNHYSPNYIFRFFISVRCVYTCITINRYAGGHIKFHRSFTIINRTLSVPWYASSAHVICFDYYIYTYVWDRVGPVLCGFVSYGCLSNPSSFFRCGIGDKPVLLGGSVHWIPPMIEPT